MGAVAVDGRHRSRLTPLLCRGHHRARHHTRAARALSEQQSRRCSEIPSVQLLTDRRPARRFRAHSCTDGRPAGRPYGHSASMSVNIFAPVSNSLLDYLLYRWTMLEGYMTKDLMGIRHLQSYQNSGLLVFFGVLLLYCLLHIYILL